MNDLRTAAQQALEALEHTTPIGFNMESDKRFYAAITALRERLAREDEPVFDCPRCGHCCPQPAKWVGLTEDEVDDIWNKYCDEMGEASINDAEDIARAIEAKLKGKNHVG